MRGRKPRPLTLAPADLPALQTLACRHTAPFAQVQRAHIVLAVANGQRIGVVADHNRCDRATVWRLCRRYEQHGLAGLLADAPRPGRPWEISPLAACPDRRPGLPGAD